MANGILETPYGASTYNRSVVFSWTGTANGNSTIINWTLKSGGSEKTYGVKITTIDLKINNKSIFYTSNYEAIHTASRATTYTPYGETIKSGSLTIDHNSNGEAQMSVSLSAYIYSTTVSSSKTFDLDKLATASSLAVPTFVLGRTTSEVDGNIVTNQYGITPITIYQKKDKTTLLSNYGHKLKYKVGNSNYRYITAFQNEGNVAKNIFIYESTPSISEYPNSLLVRFDPPESDYQYVENGMLSGTIVLETYSDTACSSSKLIGTCSLPMVITIPDSFKPTISATSYTLDNTGHPNVSTLGIALSGITTINLKLTAKSNTNATIKTIDVTNGGTKSYSASASTVTITNQLGIVPRNGGSYVFDITATDNKGLTSNKAQIGAITVYPYDVPRINNFVANRRGSSTNVAVYCNASPVSVKVNNIEKNSITSIALKYREFGTTTWSNYTGTTITNGSFVDVTNFNNTKKYELKIVVTDAMGGVNEQIQIVPKAETYMHLASKGLGIGIGKALDYTDTKKRVEIDPSWELRVHGKEIETLINDSVDVLFDSTVADYVVSQGTSGVWYYRKWSSGHVECWARITATTDSSGGANIKTALPFTITNGFINASFGSTQTIGAQIRYVSMSTTSIDVYGANGGASKSAWFYVHILGNYS